MKKCLLLKDSIFKSTKFILQLVNAMFIVILYSNFKIIKKGQANGNVKILLNDVLNLQ